MEKLSLIDPELGKIKEEKKLISSKLDKINAIINDKEDKIQDVKQ